MQSVGVMPVYVEGEEWVHSPTFTHNNDAHKGLFCIMNEVKYYYARCS